MYTVIPGERCLIDLESQLIISYCLIPGYLLLLLFSIRIIVGAPYGRYPGGLDLPLNRSICQQTGNYTDEELAGLTDTQIGLCYQCTGLVYQCPLVGDGTCSGMLGNGNETGVDGTLFDRQGEK